MNDLIFVGLSTFAAEDHRPLELLKNSGFPFKIHNTGKRITTDELLKDAIEATVILAGIEQYDARTLKTLSKLRCISRCGVGVDSIDLVYAKQNGITVANTPDIPALAVAELALTMFLSLSRNIRKQANLMQSRQWKRLSTHLLSGRTIGLIGFGRIGRRVAELCNAFNCFVIAYDPIINYETNNYAGVKFVSIEEMLRTSDIISIHASKLPGKSIIIGHEEIAKMKKGSIIVNLARGEMVDESALVSALEDGHIAGAGLDVFSKEPYEGPLCDFDQVILTPHSATLPVETRAAMELQCLENAIAFLKGKLLPERKVI